MEPQGCAGVSGTERAEKSHRKPAVSCKGTHPYRACPFGCMYCMVLYCCICAASTARAPEAPGSDGTRSCQIPTLQGWAGGSLGCKPPPSHFPDASACKHPLCSLELLWVWAFALRWCFVCVFSSFRRVKGQRRF